MKSSLLRDALLVCLMLFASGISVVAKTQIKGERIALSNLSAILEQYLAETGGKVPSDLQPLADYADLDAILGKSKIGKDFTSSFAFIPGTLTVSFPGQGQIDIVLLEIEPRDGYRAAVWRNAHGSMDSGYLREAQLQTGVSGIDLNALRPMGGIIPPFTKTLPEVEPTEYQKRVVALAREGKLEMDSPPSSRPKVTSIVIVVSVFVLLAYFRLRKSYGRSAG